MNELEQLLAMLGVATFAEATASIANFNAFLGDAKVSTGKASADAALTVVKERVALLSSVETATGVTGDAVVGVVRAWKDSAGLVAGLQAKIADFEKAGEGHAFDKLVTAAKDARRGTPAQHASVRASFDAKEITLKGAEAWLANLTTLPGSEQREVAAPPSVDPNAKGGDAPKFNGKTYAEMTPTERVALKRADPALFKAMRPAN